MALITKSGADALIPVEQSREIIANIPQKSKLLPLMRRLPNMSSAQRTTPVLNSLPTAYFVSGADESGVPGKKQTTNAEWGKLTLTAEELAVIVPIPEAVLADADYDIWGELKPQIEEAFAVAIDKAILFGTNKPASWAAAIVPTAITAGNSIEIGTNVDVAGDIIGEGGLMDLVAADGYRVNGFLADATMEAKLRNLRTTDNGLLYLPALTANEPDTLVGRSVQYDTQGVFDNTTALMVAGDFSKAVYAIRQDLTYKVLDQAVIQDTSTGDIVYNLAQNDMVALRCVMRLGVQVANPINRMNGTAATRYPFAVLTPETPET